MRTSLTLITLFIAFGAFFDAAGQLPRFRFIGTPDISYPTEWVYLVDDGIVCLTETPNSRWDKKEVGHYYYSISAKTWNRLERLDSTSASFGDAVWQSGTTLNDSLILFSIKTGTDSSRHVCWNYRRDSLYFSFDRNGRDTNYSSPLIPEMNAQGDFVSFERNRYLDSSYRFITYHRDKRRSDTIYFHVPVSRGIYGPQFIPSINGYWIEMGSIVLWTDDFQRFDTTVIPISKTYEPYVYQLNKDKEGLIGVLLNRSGFVEIHEIKAPGHLTSTLIKNDLFIRRDGFYDWKPAGGSTILIHDFGRQNEDGIYQCDSNGIHFLGTTRTRITLHDLMINSNESISIAANSGLMVSHDSTKSWSHIPLPVTVPSHTDTTHLPSITLSDEGTLVWGGGRSMMSYYDRPSGSFSFIPGTHYVFGFPLPVKWYRRGDRWLGPHLYLSVVSTDRGIYQAQLFAFPREQTLTLYSYSWLDTILVRSASELSFTCWPPNDTIQVLLNVPEPDWYKYENIIDPIHLGGQRYSLGSYRPRWIGLVELTKPFGRSPGRERTIRCSEKTSSVTYYYRDSLITWIEDKVCSEGIAHSIEVLFTPSADLDLKMNRRVMRPDVVYPVRDGRYFGHDSLIIGLIKKDKSSTTPDSVVIMPRDLSTQRVFPLEGIEEPYVYRLLYDKVNRVYYAQTARGVYCSDVATSVDEELSSSAGDPASESAMSVTWYDILGAEVAAPISAGMYLKVTRSTNGTQTVEKIILQ